MPEPPVGGSHYAEIGAFQGSAYHRNAFALGTVQEAAVLAEVLDLPAGATVLDVGCGDGRHVRALAAAGHRALGVDLSHDVLAGAGRPAEGVDGGALIAARAQALPLADGSVDAVISICQGGFGLTPAQDRRAVGEWSRVLRTGGRIALTAFSLVFASRWMGPEDAIDVDRGLHHHLAEVRGADGGRRRFDLWTAAYSVPHLRDLLDDHGLEVLGTAGVEPGRYRTSPPPGVDDPEVLLWAVRR